MGLCEYVQHVAIFDYIAVSASLENRVCEFVDHLHEHFLNPVEVVRGRHRAPLAPGYSAEMRPESLTTYVFPQGGVGLCEYVQHLAIFDYIAVSASLENRVCEFVDHLHEHFLNPVEVVRGRHRAPLAPGYSAEMRPESLTTYVFPQGGAWQKEVAAV